MSAELLLNLDTTTSKKNNVNSSPLNKSEPKEKKEGNSLFDSLMNEAKSENKTEEKINSKTTEQKHDAQANENKTPKSTEKNKTIETDSKTKTTFSEENISNNNNKESVKKMVDKLVDIVVNAAKELFDGEEESSLEKKELKNAVEKIVESKLNNIVDKDQLKNIIEKKLDIVQVSVDKIEKESKNISLEDEKTKKSKDIMQNEVVIIKDNVKEIKENVTSILTQKETKSELKEIDNQKETKSELKEIDNKKANDEDIDTSLKNKIEKNLSIIDDSTEEIKTIISRVNESISKESSFDKLKENDPKIEYKVGTKVETIKDAITDIKEKVFETIIVKTTGDEIKNLDTSLKSVSIANLTGKENTEKPLLATMFLNAQKAIKDKISLAQINEAKTNITEKKSLESVKVSADKLELNIEETEVEHIEEKGNKPISIEKKEELKTNSLINNRALNRVLLEQRVDIAQINTQKNTESSLNTETIEMNVPKDLVQNLQNKIIGAQQKMGSFMSEVARNMYLNYKPPVTAFRVNLNPANLGTISIMMKANKVDNSLSVSMNLSNSNTMEVFTENKTVLQNAIQRQFNDTSNVSINFNMQDQNFENEFSQNNNDDQHKKNKEQASDIESNDVEEQELIEQNDYM